MKLPIFRRSLTAVTSLTTLAPALLLSGCPKDSESQGSGIEIAGQSAALTAVENTEIGLKGIVDSGDFLADSTSLAGTISAFNGSQSDCADTSPPCPVGDANCVPGPVVDCTDSGSSAADLQKLRDDVHQAVDDTVAFLRDKVLIQENLDASGTTATQVTYKLGPKVVCQAKDEAADAPKTNTSSGAAATPPAPSTEAELDPQCVADVERANLRLRLTQPREGDVDLTFVLGAENYQPATVQLYRDRIGIRVDLEQTLKSLVAMGEDTSKIEALTGVAQLQLIKNAARNYSLQLSVLQDLTARIKNDPEEHPNEIISLSLAASDPTMDITLDGNTKTISARYNYGALRFLAPLNAIASSFETDSAEPTSSGGSADVVPTPEKVYTGIVDFFLAGYTGKVTYTAQSDTFHYTDFSLGNASSTLKHDGKLLASVDLNPDSGRSFDMDVTAQTLSDGSTSALVTLDPTIDFRAQLSFENIADQVKDLNEDLLHESLRLWFDGVKPAFTVQNSKLHMLKGAMHISSQAHPDANVDVAEGMCLISKDDEEPTPPSSTGSSDVAPPPVESGSQSLFNVQAGDCQ